MNLPINKIICGDALTELKKLPDESVDCCITSPPYWGLRDYGTAKWEGGDPNCDHNPQKADGGERNDRSLPLGRGGVYKDICKCGARRIDDQLGLEKTPEEYVAKMVEVFREVKRVLKKEGTCWLNLGDSYNGNKTGNINASTGGIGKPRYSGEETKTFKKVASTNLKQKDLVGIPWRVAFALQADGWYLRQDIIWAKPNPMPESVTDRCTKSHEYIFLLTKSPKYYYDNRAIKEKAKEGAKKFNASPSYKEELGGINGERNEEPIEIRNKRSVWTVTTKPFREAHFATFPEDLIEPMVMAGCPKKGIVLDPFIGSGTTGLVAKKLGRNYLGIELNLDYIKMAEERIRGQTKPLL